MVFDSIAQAAARLDVPKCLLRGAKASGCTSFRGGRIHYDDELRRWLKENKSESGEDKSQVTQETLARIRLHMLGLGAALYFTEGNELDQIKRALIAQFDNLFRNLWPEQHKEFMKG